MGKAKANTGQLINDPASADGSGVELIYRPQSARLLTSKRSTLDLLSRPWPFSQVALLSADEFLKAADHRRIHVPGGHSLDLSCLEALQRAGILVPFYRVQLSKGTKKNVRDVAASLTLRHVHSTHISELFAAALEGRATDPAGEPFKPWPSIRRRPLWPTFDWGYLYSFHQLLGLNSARRLLNALQPQVSDGRLTWHLPQNAVSEPTIEAMQSWRSLAIVLTVLDTVYWPQIQQRIVHSVEVWRQVRLQFDPIEAVRWLGVTVDGLAQQADQLRMIASANDDFGSFYDIVRRADSDAWKTLRGGLGCPWMHA